MLEWLLRAKELKKIKSLLNQFRFINPVKAKDFLDLDFLVLQTPGWGINTPPMSLAVLSAMGKESGFKTKALDLNVEFFHKKVKFDLIDHL